MLRIAFALLFLATTRGWSALRGCEFALFLRDDLCSTLAVLSLRQPLFFVGFRLALRLTRLCGRVLRCYSRK
jgi:hypothetical protein